MAFVRVKGPREGLFTVDEAAAAHYPSEYAVQEKDAVDINGRPLAPKPATDKAGQSKASTDKPKEA